MRNLRRITQGIFLLLFLFLFIQTESKGMDELGYPVKLFLDFDPLILVTTLLASHSAAKWFYLSLILIVITLVLGRVFCGWVCPLGTLNNMVGSLRKMNAKRVSLNWHRVKYFILVFLLASSVFTLQLVGVMDPLSLLIRSFSLGIYPFFNYLTRAFFDSIYALNPPVVVDVSESVYSFLKRTVLAFQQPSFIQGFFIGILFLIVMGLNLFERRFWCRYLCPLGALLGVLSRFSLLKRSVSEGCTECGACAGVCQGNASPDVKGGWKDAECYACYNCDDVCPQNAVSFGFRGKKEAAGTDLGRRRVIVSVLSGVFAVPLMRSVPIARSPLLSPTLLRPPGSLEEREFLKR
ncbi:MAG: 4Fe-4S binding protein, partial [bacterium]